MESATVREPVLLMARYNIWANDLFVSFFRQQSDALLTRHIPGSFPSILKTLVHIWDAQQIWYMRLQGENPTVFPSSTWDNDNSAMFLGLDRSSHDLLHLAEGLTPAQLDEVINYKTMSYGPQASKRYEILLHVFNHSMYHRGQCITMARLLDMERVPSSDLIKYLRS